MLCASAEHVFALVQPHIARLNQGYRTVEPAQSVGSKRGYWFYVLDDGYIPLGALAVPVLSRLFLV